MRLDRGRLNVTPPRCRPLAASIVVAGREPLPRGLMADVTAGTGAGVMPFQTEQ